ncbi:MAG: methyltransferase domain-containing protein [Actinomycetota bacterium]
MSGDNETQRGALITDPSRSSGCCPACGSSRLVSYLDLGSVPVQANEFWPDEESATAADQAPFELAVCQNCGLLSNPAFDPEVITYDGQYEASLYFSPTFVAYADELAGHLAGKLPSGGTMVELGAGNGDFLVDVCRRAGASGVAFDPSYAAGATHRDGVDLRFVGSLDDVGPIEADLLAARHVVEHLHEPTGLLASATKMLASRGELYIEVPDASFTLDQGGVWDLIYPHVLYFTAPTLAHFARLGGFTVDRCESTFGGQFLALEARPGNGSNPEAPIEHAADVEARLARLAATIEDRFDHWRTTLAEHRTAGSGVAVWGAGSKGVTFCHLIGGDAISHVVDVNPRKHGRHLPVSGHEVVGPEALAEDPPALILVMNPNYEAEITESVRNAGIDADIVAVS